jgi:hypothetical protein
MFDTHHRSRHLRATGTRPLELSLCAAAMVTAACATAFPAGPGADPNGSSVTPGADESGVPSVNRAVDDPGQPGEDDGDPSDYPDPSDADAGDLEAPDGGDGTDLPAPGDPPDAALVEPSGQDAGADSVNRAPACPNGWIGPPDSPRPIGKGLIIPAYIGLDDVTNWNILKEGAATMQMGGSSTYRDYWVVVNGPGSAPFTDPRDWAKAKDVYDPVRCNGGAIIGYVHTCEAAQPPRTLQSKFRTLEAVEAEIDRWVEKYPALDGIWLDEFIPRLEVATIEEDGQPLVMAPNPEYVPTDPSYLTGGVFNGLQVDPRGGYYDRLRSFIRTKYRNLRIIGNAGGWLDTNQLDYPTLVDIFVSYEQTYAEASKNGWSRLKLQVNSVPQLALIHTNPNDLAGAVKQAFDYGYTHVYTTSLPLLPNVWNGLPPYFTTEVSTVANRLP